MIIEMRRVLCVLMFYFLNRILCEEADLSSEDLKTQMLRWFSEEETEEKLESSDEESLKYINLNDLSDISLVNENDDNKDLNDELEETTIGEESLKTYISELLAASSADRFGTNPHYKQPNRYNDFGRRFVPQYPYVEISQHTKENDEEEQLKPQAAPPELVLDIAKKSALLEASKPLNPTDELITKTILRTGDYWNGAWKEDVVPSSLLRTFNNKKLETVKVKIMPDSNLYEVFSQLAKISPRVLYVVNKK